MPPMQWRDGVLERWSDGKRRAVPFTQYSDTPLIHSPKKVSGAGRQGGGDGESRGKNDQTPDSFRLTKYPWGLASIFLLEQKQVRTSCPSAVLNLLQIKFESC